MLAKKKRVNMGVLGKISQSSTGEHCDQDQLGTPGNLQGLQERHWRREDNNVVGNVEASQHKVQGHPVNAAAGKGIIPVFGDGYAGNERGKNTEGSVNAHPDDETQEKLLGWRRSKDTLALEQHRELAHGMGYAICHNRAQ